MTHAIYFSIIIDCRYEGIYGKVMANEGNDVNEFRPKSLDECKALCDTTDGCNSIAWRNTNLHCYLKDKVLTGSETTVDSTDGWTTYYRKCGKCRETM